MISDVDRILIGDNPFIGVDHLSQERSREKKIICDSVEIGRIIDCALSSGAEGVVCSAHPNMKDALGFLKKQEYAKEFGVYLIVPDVQSYVRLASERGMLGLINETFGKLSLTGKAKAAIGSGLSALTSNPKKLMKTYLNVEGSLFRKSLPKNAKLKSIFLHELITELIISFKMGDLAKEYVDFLSRSMKIKPGFVTRNFSKFVDFALEAKLPMSEIIVMSPFNSIGFQMNPNRESCEKKLTENPELNVIAMSVLAAGYTNISEAASYLSKLRSNVSCVVGVSTIEHAIETFSELKLVLHTDHRTAISR